MKYQISKYPALVNMAVFIIILFSSCRKDEAVVNIELKGTIVNANTGMPIQGASIIRNTHYYLSGWSTKTTLYNTDSDGKFEISLNPEGNNNESTSLYSVECENFHPKPFFLGYGGLYNNDYQPCSNDCEIALYKPSVLKILINNVSPYDSNDYFRCWLNYLDKSGSIVYPWETELPGYSGHTELSGINVIDSVNRVLLPYLYYTISYESIKNGIRTDSSVNIFTPWNDTTVLNINY